MAGQSDVSELSDLLDEASGAGIGMLVMRFLGAKGLLPYAAGGIIGALLGSHGDGAQYNSMGQLSLNNYR